MDQIATAMATELKKAEPISPPESTTAPVPEEAPTPPTEPKLTLRMKQPTTRRSPKSKSSQSKKRSKKEESSDSDASSSSSSDSEESSASDSESTVDASAKSKRKGKGSVNKKNLPSAKQLKALKALWQENDSESDDGLSEHQKGKSRRTQQRNPTSLRALISYERQRKMLEDEESDEIDLRQDSRLKNQRQQSNSLNIDQVERSRKIARLSRARRSQSRRDTASDTFDFTTLEALLDTARSKSKKQDKAKKTKRASKVAYKRVDQLWDSTIHNYKLTETVPDEGATEWDQYTFIVRRNFDWEHKYQDTLVDIKSKPLKEALQHVMAGVKGVSLVQDTPSLEPNMLFLYLEECRTYMNKLSEEAESAKKKRVRKAALTKAQHLNVLVRYLDKEYAETKKTLHPMLESKTISFDLLWALFKPNSIAYTTTYGDHDQPRAFKIDYATKECHFMKGTWYNIEGRYLEYDGKSFGMGSMSVQVPRFQGSRRISTLDCYPIQYHKSPDEMKAQLIARGKKFVALEGVHYRFHQGMAYTKKKRQVMRININGRVMCDPAIHRRINPNYEISTIKSKEADEDDIFEMTDSQDDSSCACGSGSDDGANDRATPASSDEHSRQERKKYRVVKMPDGETKIVEVDPNEESQLPQSDRIEEKDKGGHAFTEEEFLIASPVVLGFSFNEKYWLEFTVSGISDVIFNEDAFDSLVLPDKQKSIVKALVSSHAFHPSKSIDDIISGKGRGLCCVLHGPPGTGKTLTAEGIADLLKCPLYMVSAGDLGTNPQTLEKELQNILDIAHSWGAILLLDEADVFLEKRSIQDIHRNALVSIFLRLLEYFQGILFLTTNRVETFDEAFVSRIHLSLRYEELGTKARHRVWKLFLEKVAADMEVGKITDQDYLDLARRNVNGRQIKNLVRAAQALAVYEEKPLSMAHIREVIDVAESFERDLKGGTGYSDAMRSYT